ncbi:MAG TPA: prolyl oligopeptidase family serine peptidase, partial [Byssovorax sp.]
VVADRVVFVVDAGVRHDVRVLDAATLEARSHLDLPLGSEVPGATHPNMSDGLTVAPGARRLVVQWSTPTAPPHLLLVDLDAGTVARVHEEASLVAPLRRGPRGDGPPRAPRRAPSFVTEVVRIPSFDGLELPTLVHRVPGAAPAPVVVILHGGFTLAATARWDPTIELYLEQGYAVVEPNVRGGGGFGRAYEAADDGVKKLDAARDIGAIGRWLRSEPWVDGARMALSGGSAGGYFTLLGLAFQPDLWCAGICMSGMFDLERTLRAQDGDLRAFLETELAPLDEPAILRALSPATYVDRVRAPLLVVAGDNDPRTPRAESDALVRALRASGSSVEYMRVSAQGHGFTDPRVRGELAARARVLLRDAFAGGRG